MKKVWNIIKNFWRVLFLSVKCHSANQNSQRAVALTYYTLFAVVPVAALLFGIAKGFNLDDKLRTSLNNNFSNHGEVLEKIYGFADTTLARASGGIVAGIGIVVLLWTVLSLAGNIEKALNSAWGLACRRNILRRFSDYLTVMLLTPIVLVIVTSTDMVISRSLHYIAASDQGLDVMLMTGFSIAGKLFSVILTGVVFFLIYYLAPNTKVRFKPALMAAVVAAIFYTGLQDGFVLLQKTIFRYNRVYGGFAVLPLFLVWLQFAWQIVLYGAEISYVAQNLKTGLFDDSNSTPASMRLQRVQQLTIAKIIYGNLDINKGATSWQELEDRMGISAVEIDRGLDVLLDAGIISRVEEENGGSFLPALSPEKLTVAGCVARLASFGRNNVPPELRNESCRIENALEVFETVSDENAVNHPLCKL